MKDQLETISQNISQFATLSGILAGFMFAVAFQLLGSKEKTANVSFLTGTTILASLSFLSSTIVFTFISIGTNTLSNKSISEVPNTLKATMEIGMYLFGFASICFTLAISACGYVYSKKMGKFTGYASLGAFLIVLGTVVLLLTTIEYK